MVPAVCTAPCPGGQHWAGHRSAEPKGRLLTLPSAKRDSHQLRVCLSQPPVSVPPWHICWGGPFSTRQRGRGEAWKPGSSWWGKGPHGGRGQPATRLAPMARSHTLVSGGLESLRSAQLGRADNGQALLLAPVSVAAAPPPPHCAPRHFLSRPCCLPQQGLRDPGLLVGCFYKCPGIT